VKIIDVITSRLLVIFPEISGNIKFPENLQPCGNAFSIFDVTTYEAKSPTTEDLKKSHSALVSEKKTRNLRRK